MAFPYDSVLDAAPNAHVMLKLVAPDKLNPIQKKKEQTNTISTSWIVDSLRTGILARVSAVVEGHRKLVPPVELDPELGDESHRGEVAVTLDERVFPLTDKFLYSVKRLYEGITYVMAANFEFRPIFNGSKLAGRF